MAEHGSKTMRQAGEESEREREREENKEVKTGVEGRGTQIASEAESKAEPVWRMHQ